MGRRTVATLAGDLERIAAVPNVLAPDLHLASPRAGEGITAPATGSQVPDDGR